MGDVIDDTLAMLRDCRLDDPAVRDFLEAVVEAYPKAEDADGPPFEVFSRLMVVARDEKDTFRVAVDPFLEYAEHNGGIEVARRLSMEGVDTLVRWYGEVPSDDGWLDFLAEYTERSGWDGAEDSWPQYGEFIRYYADEQGFAGAADQFLIDAEYADDKVALLASYGVTVAGPQTPAADEDDDYDPDRWLAFLVQYTELSGWDGGDDSWPAYRDYLLYYAEEHRLTGPTGSFLDAAEDEPDKRAFFDQYGITLGYAEEDLDAWYSFLAEHGPEWDGEERTWRRFRRSFLEAAAEDGLTETATVFLDHVEGEPDKIAAFAGYGVTIGDTPDEPEEPEEGAADDWNAFLAEFGPGWNGDEQNWPAFREWFLFYAEERDLGEVATSFLDYAEGEPDKVAFFARYGVDVTVPADVPDEVAAAIQTAEAVAAASPAVADEHVQLVSAAFAELLAEVPEAAGLSEAQIRQLIEEVAAEHL